MTWHSPRTTGEDGWKHVLDLATGAALVAKWRKPVVSDEPVGAGPELAPGRRDNSPDRFAAAAALTRLAGLHPTFHYEAGLQGAVPAGTELECFNGWNAALNLMNDLPRGGTFLERGAIDRVVLLTGARAAFARQFDDAAWVVGIDAGPEASVVPAAGWRLLRQDRLGRLLVARLQRL